MNCYFSIYLLGWETLVDKYGGIDKLQNKCNEVTKKNYGNQAKQGYNPC